MSAESLFSAHWHRVRDVRPQLAEDVVVTRHVYRGQPCHVLQRRATTVCHRLDTASFELIDRLDGKISVGELWERAMLEREDTAPTQDALTNLLAGLHAAELLVIDQRIPTEQLFERREKRRARERRERRMNPLYLRFALYDPDAWLTRLEPLARALFSRTAFILWTLLLGSASLTLFAHGSDLADALSDPALLSPRMAVLFVVLYPPLKLLHELGHAFAIKRAGGAVHETGIAFMVLMPLPYVDASASAALPDKRDRMRVSAAGIVVELAIAACGAFLWIHGAGTVREIGLVLLLTGGVSTLLVNGNPLLRFDGYYLLADWLEIPNLSTRARRATLGALRRFLTGDPDKEAVTEDRGELGWLLGYGVVASVYRTGLMLYIAWWLSDRFLVFGLALAAFAVFWSVLMPIGKGLAGVRRDPPLQGVRPLALMTTIPAVLLGFAVLLPLPYASVTRGVVWLPDEAVVRAVGACEISDAAVTPGQDVRAGDVLFECHDSELALAERVQVARLDELDARLGGFAVTDPLEHRRFEPDRKAARAALADTRRRVSAGVYVAALDGRFDVSGTASLAGTALARGDIVGYVVPPEHRTIRIALGERAVGRLDTEPARVEVRVAAGGGDSDVHASSIIRRSPRATREVPSDALSTVGGGVHAIDPASDGRRLLDPVIDIELAWPSGLATAAIGEPVDVRFRHAPIPLAARLLESLRDAFAERVRT